MGLPIPIIDGLIKAGESIINKIWMDKGDKEKIELTRAQMTQNFEITLKQMDQDGGLRKIEQIFREHQAQRDFANDQFGKMEILKEMGWVGKIIALGRASIRWVITIGSMIFTWKLVNILLTEKVVLALAAGTLSTGGVWLISTLVTLIVGIPVFYVSGISIEKIKGKRNTIL